MNRIVCAVLCASLLGSALPALAQSAQSMPKPTTQTIQYPSVAAALAALHAKSGVKFSNNEDWVIAKDTDGSVWSFAPADHPAYPSVGRRTVVEQDGSFVVDTAILCQASQAACDKLRDDYQLLDQRMMEAMRNGK
jgi:hypothetical protein